MEKELTKKQKLKLKTKASAKRFKDELKKSTATAIIAAFSFLIALAWRDLITKYINEISQLSPIKGQLVIATFITLISVMGILIVTVTLSRNTS